AGCDLLMLIFNDKIKRSQPSAAPTGVSGCIQFFVLSPDNFQVGHRSSDNFVVNFGLLHAFHSKH
ncbi:hypothetical protein, partial [Pseudomonas sp. GM80]|uniref:hypothetical protein n=1 Tax=Pseudomonas sp. GM80 TaxID=1144339 RepID=UPI001EE67C5F